ncbi:unnamed protein product [Spirodela intermedia]|uniref:Uncharacterized protein n=2 Tax=Spirodela intermedia TaxID=51605 RepID=A0A7I8JAX7_SPIIN|nr:unnamed protein product [Spirodela intermedia]CAA6667270.1 unnamed protein product [Spirodela intermedia]CAA7404099.1 unnamed protein product [Spirodela intermedia]
MIKVYIGSTFYNMNIVLSTNIFSFRVLLKGNHLVCL